MRRVTVFASQAVATAIAIALAFASCRPPAAEEPAELEVVDVDAGATANMTPEGDVTEPERGPSLSGALPPSFPRDLPLPLPSSVTELSTDADVPRFVVLRSPAAPETLRRELTARLDRAGWERDGDPWRRRKDGRRVQLRLDADTFGGGTLVRVEYQPQSELP